MPDLCDFCDEPLDEDEDREPVWIGDPPRPRAFSADTTAEQPTARGSRGGAPVLLGRTAGEWRALDELLREAPQISFDTCRVVRRIMAVGDEEPQSFARGDEPPPPSEMPGTESEIDDGTAGASLEIRPDPDWPEPDMRICPYCAESLRGEANGG